jgi:hypothetical protein
VHHWNGMCSLHMAYDEHAWNDRFVGARGLIFLINGTLSQFVRFSICRKKSSWL